MRIGREQRDAAIERGEASFHPAMAFVENRLEWGAGSVLGRVTDGGVELEGGPARVEALFGAAYRRPVPHRVLGDIARAGREWPKGETCLALIHLSVARLPRLARDGDEARRLLTADRLMNAGVAPRDI